MPKPKRDVESGLRRKGFQQISGDHNYFAYRSAAGLKTRVFTKTSHGSKKDISDHLLSEMAKQCGLEKRQFLQLVDCPLDQEEYEAILRSKSLLP